jgi:hypothetical protein
MRSSLAHAKRLAPRPGDQTQALDGNAKLTRISRRRPARTVDPDNETRALVEISKVDVSIQSAAWQIRAKHLPAIHGNFDSRVPYMPQLGR